MEGALYAGLDFFAGYPITPSTEIAEHLAYRLPQVGGKFIQMEDEIASVCAIIVYITLTPLERFEASFFAILYIIEAALACFLLVFRYSLHTNPGWIFRKPQVIMTRFIVMGASILFLIAWIIFVVINYKI